MMRMDDEKKPWLNERRAFNFSIESIQSIAAS